MKKNSPLEIRAIGRGERRVAVDILSRFFREEGFAGDRRYIQKNVDLMLEEGNLVALAWYEGEVAGVATGSSGVFVEWGKQVEIGDLYVAPDFRNLGIARALIEYAFDWCRKIGATSAVVETTEEGRSLHGLKEFYSQFGFKDDQRVIYMKPNLKKKRTRPPSYSRNRVRALSV